jgi:hypothetical protein
VGSNKDVVFMGEKLGEAVDGKREEDDQAWNKATEGRFLAVEPD